jgi:hypothetical protein
LKKELIQVTLLNKDRQTAKSIKNNKEKLFFPKWHLIYLVDCLIVPLGLVNPKVVVCNLQQ